MNKSVDIRNDFLDLKLADGMDLDLQLSAGHHLVTSLPLAPSLNLSSFFYSRFRLHGDDSLYQNEDIIINA